MNPDRPKLVLWSPHRDDHFLAVSSSLRLYQCKETQSSPSQSELESLTSPCEVPLVKTDNEVKSSPSNASSFRLLDTVTYPAQSIRAAAWSADPAAPMTAAVGLLSGKLALVRFNAAGRIVKEFDPRYQRCCHAVAWNSQHCHLVALGLDRVRNGPGTLVWDVNSRGLVQPGPAGGQPVETVTEAVFGVGGNEAAVAMAWGPADPFCLAVGTGFKWLRLFDVRAAASQRPMSVVAHSRSVFGCRFDPFDSRRLATHSEDGVVKIWDARHFGTANAPTPVFTLTNSNGRGAKSKPLLEADWCPTARSCFATLSKDDNAIRMWDLSGALSMEQENDTDGNEHPPRAPLTDLDVMPPCRLIGPAAAGLSSFAWHPHHKQRLLTVTKDSDQRMMTVTKDRDLADLRIHDSSIVGFGPHNEIYLAIDEHLIAMSEHSDLEDVNNPWTSLIEDIGPTMERRAKCGYALDIMVNQRLTDTCARDAEINRIWSWMNHMKSNVSHSNGNINERATGEREAGEKVDDEDPFAGVLDALVPPADATDDERRQFSSVMIGTPHSTPSVNIYVSAGRQRALHACGWFDTLTPVSGILTKRPNSASIDSLNYESYLVSLEMRGEFERAAMIAVFHLDLKRALSALNAGAEQRVSAAEKEVTSPTGSALPQPSKGTDIDLNLVSLALAGYQSSNAVNHSPNSNVAQLWQRPFAATLQHRRLSSQLKAIFSFLSLSHSGSKGSLALYNALLSSRSPLLSMRDRLAFACRFLPDTDLRSFVRTLTNECIARGDLDGIMLTGLHDCHGGVQLIQSYVDRTSDVQTAALLACWGYVSIARLGTTRTEGQLSHSTQASIMQFDRWVHLYRSLLNQWRLWSERAKLDISRSLLHHRYAPQARGNVALTHLMPNITPQVYARCTFCTQPLHYENLNAPSALSKRMASRRTRVAADASASVMGCPHCRQPLPRCALCLVSMDVRMGPSVASHHSSKHKVTPPVNDTISFHIDEVGASDPRFDQASSSEFGRWFSWCQRCRHAGHASHIQQWFAQHSICPVHDCNCQCALYSTFHESEG